VKSPTPSRPEALFELCVNPLACQDRKINERCAATYRGLLCAGCDDGYGINEDFQCVKCSSKSTQLGVFIAVLLSALLASGGLVAYTIRTSEKDGDDYKKGKNIPMHILLTAVSMMQSAAFFQGFEYTWPDAIKGLFKTTQTASGGGLGFLNMQCLAFSISSKISHVYLVALVTIFIIPFCVLVFVIVLLALKYFGAPAKLRRRLNICVFHVLFLFQPLAVQGILKAMTCKTIGGTSYLFYDPDIKCWSGSHLEWFVGLLLVFLLYTSFLPGLNLLALFNDRDLILAEQEEALRSWGFEIEAWEREYYYWNLVIMARKLSLTAVITLSRPMGIVVQSQLAIAICIVALISHVRCEPYREPLLNRLEMISISTFGMTAWIGVLMSQETSYTLMKQVGSFVIVAFNGSAILLMMWHFVFQAIYWVKEKVDKLRESQLPPNPQPKTGNDIELAEMNPVALAVLDQEEEDKRDLEEVGVVADDDQKMADEDV